MDVLSVASEVYPLVKTGGLADVAGALPGALAAHDVSMRTLVPGYPQVLSALKKGRQVAEFDDLFGGPAQLIAGRAEGLDLIVIAAPHLYERPGGIYVNELGKDWTDNWARFAALGWVAAELAKGLVDGYEPRIIHAHDWQGAMAAAYVAFGGDSQTQVVVTIHNLAFQGQFGAEVFPHLRLPDAAFTMHGVEYYGGVGFLKAGLQCAHAITTVSPTYAREIRTPEYGMGLEGLLNQRGFDLHGILNGIDTDAWNPQTDTALAAGYGASTISKRGVNKLALAQRFGLDQSDGPLFGIVSRLTWQKGIDLVADNVDWLVTLGGQLAVLGSGEPQLEAALSEAAARHPGRVGFVSAYDEELSHLIQGGADIIFVPSRFEPCGLTQLYGLRYGAVPLVSRVGGLADTVIDANTAAVEAGVATGVQFSPVESGALGEAIMRAMNLYGQPAVWSRMQRKGMKTDVSWNRSAEKYAGLYTSLLRQE
ncbi:glycogen synthase GlgA [Pelagibacterium xiamenense]|uniref:glycogen synthase GlgA n=1 Tax=Pelagibacterium xiamenense TaxID=2901140 RepID=UPI001E33BF46|nr:glycogen synthase GlgA [Pelagibacterium xiamenense]MCD7060167.1 glycogen synthase GlgA [Pelagibacterium xiamenense]